MFEQPRFSVPVLVLLFLIPQSLYVIGDFIAWGIRFPLFRWQDSVYGTSLIPLNRELEYVLSGQIGGRTAIATGLWVAGVILLVATAALVISWQLLENAGHAPYPGPLVIITGVLFLSWGLVQYGPLFSGPSGYAIPVGVPILWYCGWQFMQAGKAAVTGE